MWLFIKKVFLFLLISIFGYSMLFILISFNPQLQNRTNIKSATGGYGASLLRYRETLKTNNIDVLFCGSSHCYRGFDTRIFNKAGIRSFNFGSSAQTPLNTFYLLKDFASEMQPKKIVLEVYWITLQNKGVESAIDLISNTRTTQNNFIMGMSTHTFDPLKTWIYQKLHRLKFPLDYEELLPSKVDTYIPGGFVETIRDSNKFFIKEIRDKIPLDSFVQLAYIDSIYQYCLTNQIDLILINTPVYELVVMSIPNYIEKMGEIKQFAFERNLQFIDFNSDENYQHGNWNPAIDWYDDTHLTQRGVEKFNNLLIEKYGKLLKD